MEAISIGYRCSYLQVESGRYHIYIGNACPWCHRVLLALIVRGLTQHISVTWAADDPERASRGGWVFNSPEPVFGKKDLRYVDFAILPRQAASMQLHRVDILQMVPTYCLVVNCYMLGEGHVHALSVGRELLVRLV